MNAQAATADADRYFESDVHVLVLEGRLDDQTLIQKQLKKFGIDCALAANGIRGLERASQLNFDLILCDCSMPGMNGYEFARALRQREHADGSNRRIPIIALSAKTLGETSDAWFRAGVDDFISTPVTADGLAAMLFKWLSPAKFTATADQLERETVASPVIDFAVLAEVLGTGDPNTTNQVLAQFLATAGSWLSDVETAVLSGDCARIKTTARSAKTRARGAGAMGLAELYAELELKAKDGRPATVRGLVARAGSELHHVKKVIHERLRSRKAQLARALSLTDDLRRTP